MSPSTAPLIQVLASALRAAGSVGLAINAAAIIFAFALFVLSLYSWSRRKHRTLLFFAGAFLAFLVEELLEVALPSNTPLTDYLAPALTLSALVLFFFGLLLGSGIGLESKAEAHP